MRGPPKGVTYNYLYTIQRKESLNTVKTPPARLTSCSCGGRLSWPLDGPSQVAHFSSYFEYSIELLVQLCIGVLYWNSIWFFVLQTYLFELKGADLLPAPPSVCHTTSWPSRAFMCRASAFTYFCADRSCINDVESCTN